jgi:hypothetical protein
MRRDEFTVAVVALTDGGGSPNPIDAAIERGVMAPVRRMVETEAGVFADHTGRLAAVETKRYEVAILTGYDAVTKWRSVIEGWQGADGPGTQEEAMSDARRIIHLLPEAVRLLMTDGTRTLDRKTGREAVISDACFGGIYVMIDGRRHLFSCVAAVRDLLNNHSR